jgi:aminoglycoside phosphotransferase (APT) family kinase protein
VTPAELRPRLARIFGEVDEPHRLSGGASQETWAFAAADRELILRRRPDGIPPDESLRSPGMAAEAAAIQAVAARGSRRVPQIVHVLTPADDAGEGYVMVRAEGETLGQRIVRGEAFAAVRPRLAAQCGAVLAEIHATPPPMDVPLAAYAAAADLDRYEEIYRASGAERPVLELAFRWLRDRVPEPQPLTLVHGDFRNGNIMFHPARGVEAALDWELTHIGDPAEDLGWICTAAWRFGGYDKPVGGFGDYAQLLDGYAQAGGREIPLPRVQFWEALGSLRWGVMCLGMYLSWASGVNPSVERPMIGRRVSENEIDLLNLMERAA